MAGKLLKCFSGVVLFSIVPVYFYHAISGLNPHFGRLKSFAIRKTAANKWIATSFLSSQDIDRPRMSPADSEATQHLLGNDEPGLFHLVTNFVPFDHKDVRRGLRINGLFPTDEEIEARMSEIFHCLQRNLNNELVAYVHLLVFRNETVERLLMLKMKSIHKLIIHRNSQSPTVKDSFVYATKYLKGKTVIALHQDNYLGEGWEKVNHTVLRNNRLMYALTRHPVNCSAAISSAHCGPGMSYIGSHDAFALHIHNSMFEKDQLKQLNVPPNTHGMENVLLWIFQNRLKYKVLNSCLVLKVYHNHCVPIRDNWRKRINNGRMNGLVGFTDKLI